MLSFKEGGATMGTSTVTIYLDDELKKRFEEIVDDLELSMSAAFIAFANVVVREEKIPFELSRGRDDYFTPANVAVIRKSLEQAKRGELIAFGSVEELEREASQRSILYED
jgi:addiction module RelB/DinJ family antitoxin